VTEPDRLLADLDAHQRAAVTEPHGPLAILAPAGSGKTRVLTRRIAFRVREQHSEARHVLAVTFTRRAAGELVDRLEALGVDAALTAGTFHALALAQLRRRAADRRTEPPRVLDRKARILGPLLRARAKGPVSNAALGLAVGDVAAEIEWAKARMIPPDRFAAAAAAAERRLPLSSAELADLYAGYESEKRRKRWLDFDDLLAGCADAIETDGSFAAAQRWRFRDLFVDEFQDATPLQMRLLRAWLGGRSNLTVVGDAAQAIYGFAGADASPLAEFRAHFPGGRTIALAYNYRSTGAIVAVAEAALGPAAGVERDPPRAVRSADRPATIAIFDDDAREAAAIADACRHEFTGGVPWHRMGVLFRTNAQSSLFETAFARRGVPFRIAGAARFATRPVVRTLLDRLRATERADPARSFAEHLADLAADADEPPASGAERTPAVADEELREHRDALLDFGREYAELETGPRSVAGFVSWLDLATRTDTRGERGVDLVTFHRAKGLEWQVVFVTGLERGLVPISWATTPAAHAEERRLLHVALGRAEDTLHCSWARVRTAAGRRSARQPSPWLGDLEQAIAGVPVAAVDRRARLGEARAALHESTPPRATSHARRATR
jgi:DNA helicase-2/ATP-dependent DNA helicase PcrA